jgi:class 3 adenylate cyclase
MGDDIGGIAVHIAARVCGLAAAGEVLISRTVRATWSPARASNSPIAVRMS